MDRIALHGDTTVRVGRGFFKSHARHLMMKRSMEAVPYSKFSPSSSGTARSFTTHGQWLRFRVHVAQLSEIASLGWTFSAGGRVNPKTHPSNPQPVLFIPARH
jgi:hypothetical protein